MYLTHLEKNGSSKVNRKNANDNTAESRNINDGITNKSNNLTQYNLGNNTNPTAILNNGTTNTTGNDQSSTSYSNGKHDVYIITGVGAGLLLTAFVVYYFIFKRKTKPMPFKFTPENHSSLYHPDTQETSNRHTLTPVLSVRNSLNIIPRSPIDVGPEIPFSPQPQLLPLNNKIKH